MASGLGIHTPLGSQTWSQAALTRGICSSRVAKPRHFRLWLQQTKERGRKECDRHWLCRPLCARHLYATLGGLDTLCLPIQLCVGSQPGLHITTSWKSLVAPRWSPGVGFAARVRATSGTTATPSMDMEGMQGKGIRHCPGPTKAHQLAFILHRLCPGHREDPLHMGKPVQRG